MPIHNVTNTIQRHTSSTVHEKYIVCYNGRMHASILPMTLLCVVLHIRMELELVGLVSNRKVALGDPVPASLEGHLVAG